MVHVIVHVIIIIYNMYGSYCLRMHICAILIMWLSLLNLQMNILRQITFNHQEVANVKRQNQVRNYIAYASLI